MTIIESIGQGILQGLTEFLPVSSSGHLSLFQHFTGLSGETGAVFTIILHVGTLIAIIGAFYGLIWDLIKEFIEMVKDIFKGKFTLKNMNGERNMIVMVITALIPLAIIYVLLGKVYSSVSSDESILVEGLCFLFTAFLLTFADKFNKGKKDKKDITFKDAFIVGTFQAIAPLPGVSRSGSTICSGLMRGFSKPTAVAYSFILGIPAIMGGAVMELKDVDFANLGVSTTVIIVGLVVSAVVGFLSIKMVEWLVKKDKFKIFSIYTLVLGIVVIIVAIIEIFAKTNIMNLIAG